MLIRIPNVLTGDALARCQQIMIESEWVDGAVTAGKQSVKVKNNLQLPEQSAAATEASKLVLAGLANNALFITAALPKKIFKPLFNCYTGEHNTFGNHIDNAIRTHKGEGGNVRTDLSATLFLSEPDSYEGGELVIEDTFGTQRVKLAAGDMILYPSSSVHRVEPVTKGARIASFFWIESMIRETERRRLLYEMDMALLDLRSREGDTEAVVRLTGCYHNLVRMWADS
ncbi:Fe2+-dependent dioxygenase [Leeia sp. TBRC 13508]|uniref:Fe2+-dependent dioxygenase n=1 Tax=Leeia speluncae TaxID=2884804 RepID=A0ABS8D673_9NEIS|nr:Fe2+-dependent dioxygenase [Leeia speluncae]MCB6183714.1 Fe2+-dependent dioxygenase [Leeia speluncae]